MSGRRWRWHWRAAALAGLCITLAACAAQAAPALPAPASAASPLSIGETFTIDSAILGERRRINIYLSHGSGDKPLPLLLMPDGGIDEDFLHVAGLLQVGASNGTTRPFLLAGIENTERRRDLTGPTSNAKDRAIAPRVGGSARFRQFIDNELLPELARRYRLTKERAIVGESLAGLFVVETLLTAPAMFDTYIAIDPSLWWNDSAMLRAVQARAPAFGPGKSLYLAASRDATGPDGDDGAALAVALGKSGTLRLVQRAWPLEGHATIYHPAALAAFRELLGPVASPPGAAGMPGPGQVSAPQPLPAPRGASPPPPPAPPARPPPPPPPPP